MEPKERNLEIDQFLRTSTLIVLSNLMDECHLHPDARRLWSAFDLPGGGRLYLEYRRY